MERLQQIADIFGISKDELEHFDEKKIFINAQHSNETKDNATVHFYLNINETAHSKYVEHLEKTIERQQIEIEFLREQIKNYQK